MTDPISALLATLPSLAKAGADIASASDETKRNAQLIEFQKAIIGLQANIASVQAQNASLAAHNRELEQELKRLADWSSRLENYELVETSGGAIVYKSKQAPEHYICPSCKEKSQIHILQDNRTWSGKFRCVNCEAEFPVKPRDPTPTPQVQTRRPR